MSSGHTSASPSSGTTPSSAHPAHLRRDQVLVTVAAVVWIVGTLFGTGLVGPTEGVSEQGDGLFSDSATLIAPHGPAFAIWSLIYLLLAGYVVWQWWAPGSRWAALTRLPGAAAIALNGIWLLVVFGDLVSLSVVVMLGIVGSLGWVLRASADLPAEGWAPTLLVSVTFGLYLGWICVATCANIASWLVGLGVPADGTDATIITVGVLLTVILVVAFLLSRTRQPAFRAALAAAVVWGLVWVSVGRFTGDLRSAEVGWAAGFAAVCVAGVWLVFQLPGARRRVDEGAHA